jgi:hypothetical protein
VVCVKFLAQDIWAGATDQDGTCYFTPQAKCVCHERRYYTDGTVSFTAVPHCLYFFHARFPFPTLSHGRSWPSSAVLLLVSIPDVMLCLSNAAGSVAVDERKMASPIKDVALVSCQFRVASALRSPFLPCSLLPISVALYMSDGAVFCKRFLKTVSFL